MSDWFDIAARRSKKTGKRVGPKVYIKKGDEKPMFPDADGNLPHVIYVADATLISEGKSIDVYSMQIDLQTAGTQTVTWEGANGENFVASIKIRQELDPLYRDPLWLMEQYVKKERSMADIADQFGITPTAIHQWLLKHDIPTRSKGRKKHDN